MKRKKVLTREKIVQTVAKTLKPLDFVYALWEGGAAAFDRVDEWSDIDLYLVVDDKKVDEAFIAVEKALKLLCPIEQKYEVLHPPSLGLSQAFYRLQGASDYLLIDLAVLKSSSPEKYLEPEVHGNAIFYFNKSIKVPPTLDEDAFAKKLQDRLDKLKAKFTMFNSFVQKEINRGNHLEALDFYNAYTLAALVSALRIRYNPFHHNFRMHYIHYELPSEIITKLEHLCFVRDEKDLQEKHVEATCWFHEIVSEIDKGDIKG